MDENFDQNAFNSNVEEKVVTLNDLKKRREELLAQKLIILKRKHTEKITQEQNKHTKLNNNPTDSKHNSSINLNFQPSNSIAVEPLNLDDEITSQADTILVSSNSMFQESINITDLVLKENDINLTNIDNLQFTELENASYNFIDNNNDPVLDSNDFLQNNIHCATTSPTIDESIEVVETSNHLEALNTDETSMSLITDNTPIFFDGADITVSELSSSQPKEVVTLIAISNSPREGVITLNEILGPQLTEIASVIATSHSPEDFSVIVETPNDQPDESPLGETSNSALAELESTGVYHGDLSLNRKRQNKANKEPEKWKKAMNKDLRMKGEAYLGYRRVTDTDMKKKIYHDVSRPARRIKPACDSLFCKKSKLRNCDNIDEEKRRELFETFWKKMSWDQRKMFVCCHVTPVEKKVTKNPQSTRSKTLGYYLTIENVRHQVCKKMFLNTLGIKEWFLRYWLEKTNSAMPSHSDHSRNISHARKKADGHEYAENFLKSLPKMPSHYCRASTSRQYLEPLFQNLTDLYKEYTNKCEYESVAPLSRTAFTTIFQKLNLSLYRPKKDRCDLCCGHETGTVIIASCVRFMHDTLLY